MNRGKAAEAEHFQRHAAILDDYGDDEVTAYRVQSDDGERNAVVAGRRLED